MQFLFLQITKKKSFKHTLKPCVCRNLSGVKVCVEPNPLTFTVILLQHLEGNALPACSDTATQCHVFMKVFLFFYKLIYLLGRKAILHSAFMYQRTTIVHILQTTHGTEYHVLFISCHSPF